MWAVRQRRPARRRRGSASQELTGPGGPRWDFPTHSLPPSDQTDTDDGEDANDGDRQADLDRGEDIEDDDPEDLAEADDHPVTDGRPALTVIAGGSDDESQTDTEDPAPETNSDEPPIDARDEDPVNDSDSP